jgi:hypothetical protein
MICRAHSPKVAGSNPATAIETSKFFFGFTMVTPPVGGDFFLSLSPYPTQLVLAQHQLRPESNEWV